MLNKLFLLNLFKKTYFFVHKNEKEIIGVQRGKRSFAKISLEHYF